MMWVQSVPSVVAVVRAVLLLATRGVVLPRGNKRRDFIDRCESPLRCAADCGICLWVCRCIGKLRTLSPVPLAGAFVWAPLPPPLAPCRCP
jgi:hypothetical protein